MGKYYGVSFSLDENSLAHHGIKGQRWGIRRFQNEDGTLTDEGKKRYGNSVDEIEKQLWDLNDRRQDLQLDKWFRSGSGLKGVLKRRDYDKKIAEITKEYNEIDEVYKSMLTGGKRNATPYESEYEKDSYKSLADKKLMAKITKVIDQSNDPDIQEAKKYADSLKNASKELDEAFYKYLDMLQKSRGKEWDGDGTEAHWALEKRYPAYNKISKNQEKARKEFCSQIIKISQKPEFDNIKEFDKYKGLLNKYKGWYEMASNRSYAIASAVLKAHPSDASIFYDSFIEAFDNSGQKMKNYWRNTL